MNIELLIKYGKLVLIVLFALWLGHDLSYEPLIGLLASIGAFAFPDFKKLKNQNDENAFQHDKEIYEQIVIEFESNHLDYFLREVDFYNTFNGQKGLDLIAIAEGMVGPKYEFWDEKMEETKNSLFSKLDDLTHKLGYETYPIHNGRQTAIPDVYRHDFAELPEEIENRIKGLNQLASEVLEKYSKFYKLGGIKYEKMSNELINADGK